MEPERKIILVEVTAKFQAAGGVVPLSVRWRDGREFYVDKVISSARAPSRVGPYLPIRYTCLIRGAERFLYFQPEKLRWFVEAFDI